MKSTPSENEPISASEFFFIGNHPALDFANTLAATKEGPLDLIPDICALGRWLDVAQLAAPPDWVRFQKALSPPEADLFLQDLKNYRAHLKSMIFQLEKDQTVPESFLAQTNTLLSQAPAVLQARTRGPLHFERTWSINWQEYRSVLGLFADLAVQLLSECDLKFIRKCQNESCVLAFYDTTKNHQRRWCRMEACGNRHKATLHRQRYRKG